MKNLKRSIVSLVVVLLLAVSSFIPSFAATGTQPATYSSEYNSGQRDVVCTTLSGTSADEYYTGYEYDTLSELSASALQSELHELMTDTHTYISSYDDCHYKADRSDCQNGDGSVSLIYTNYSATMSQWNGWNREHVWPKSLAGDSTTGGGADMHHIRPSDQVVNSTRNNKKYGNVDGGTAKYGSNPASGYLGGYYDSTYFEPLDNVKGDVARICLYVMVRWGEDWKATSITQVFESVDVLLEWCELDPVDTWEMGRNEVVEDIQGNRNVFIDYPEYAWLIFGREVPADMTTPSGEASDGEGTSSGSGSSGTTSGGTVAKPETSTAPSSTTTTATLSISSYASANGWTNDTQYTSVVVDENITATASGGGNTGKYYTSGTNWRLYQTESAKLTLTADEGCTITSVKITYASEKTGVLKYNSSTVSSGSALSVNASSVVLSVGNSGSATNGQVRVTAIEVTYTKAASCAHTNTETVTTPATCTTSGSTTVTCTDCGTTSTSTIPATGHNYVNNTCTICGGSLSAYAYSFIGPESTESHTTVGGSIVMPGAPTLSGSYKQAYVFAGWTKSDVSDTTVTPELFSAGATVTIDEDTTFYAVYTYSAESVVETTVTKYTKYSGALTAGNYLFTYNSGAMKAVISSNRLSYTDITVSGNNVTSAVDPSIVWTVAQNGSYWTLYNSSTGKYAGGNGTKNQAALITNVTDYAKWSVSGTSTYDFTNLGNSNKSVNATLRRNSTYGFACYSTGTGGALTLYKETVITESETLTTTFYTTVLQAEDTPATCQHTNTSTATVNATCTTAGSITVTCNDCSEVVSTTSIPATDHPNTTKTTVDATCTAEGSVTETCNDCGEPISTEKIPALKHSFEDGTCTRCGEDKPSDPLGLDGKEFYIAAIRSSGNYWYMTNNLGTSSTKRYTAVDSGSDVLPEVITSRDLGYVFVIEYTGNGTYYIYTYTDENKVKYLGHTSDNSGTLVDKASAKEFVITKSGDKYNVSLTEGGRNLELNKNSGSDYFAFYTGTQVKDLAFIPVSEAACSHPNKTATQTSAPTCTEAGVKTVVCDDCGMELTPEEVPALGHDLVDGICVRCGYTATYTPPSTQPTESGWVHVTDASQLKPGDKIIIVAMNTSKGSFVAGDISSDYMSSVPVTDATFKSLTSDVIVLTLGGSEGAWTLTNSGKLLGSKGAKKVAWGSGTTTWTISVDSDGNATISSTNSSYGRFLYNVNSPRFTTYTSNTNESMLLPQIYKYVESAGTETTEEVEIYGASMTVGSTLAMNYYVSGFDGTDYYMVFTMNGKTYRVDSSKTKHGYLVFTFDNIPPQMMGDTITAKIYKNGSTTVLDETEISVKEYAEKIIDAYGDDSTLMDLVADMLKYGAAAQKYVGYKADAEALVTNGVDLDGKGSDAAPTAEDNLRKLKTEQTEIDKSIYSFTAAGVRFDFNNKVYVKFKTDDISKITLYCNDTDVSDRIEDLGDGTYVFYTDGIDATEFGKSYVFSLHVDGELHQTLTYSVNSYAYAKYADEQTTAVDELALALYRYGLSAKAYTGR